MSTATTPTVHGVTPYLRYPDGAAAIAWLTDTFGFGPARVAQGSEGNGAGWYEADITAGPTTIGISGGAGRSSGGYLIVHVDDADAMCRRIRDAGVECAEPVDKDYGPRSVTVDDPWGVTWDFWQGDARY